MPSHNDVPEPALLEGVREHVDAHRARRRRLRPKVARRLDALAAEFELELVRLPERSGKGSAVRAGVDHARGADAVLVIDADGQHPAEAIPAFIEAARDAELVIGDRFSDLEQMPIQRRLANKATRRAFQLATGREVRDTQNGMRLLRGRALETLADRRLRGRDRAPAPRPARRSRGRVGRYPGDLRDGAELVSSGTGRSAGAVGSGATARTTRAAAIPTATPSTVPASTSST